MLDLFSGSGALGIEALSRGASYCVFMEKSSDAVSCIQSNLTATHLSDKARVLGMDVRSGLARLSGQERPFDLVLMDPPYHKGLELETLAFLAGSDLIDEYSILVVEAALDTDLHEAEELGYHVYRVKDYKTNRHFFLQKK